MARRIPITLTGDLRGVDYVDASLHMRIVVIDGHPDVGGDGDALARSYVEGAEAGGHEVRSFRLRDLEFDPILHGGFKTPQPLEPDLVKARDAIRWCQHFVIVTPYLWWHVPALVKGSSIACFSLALALNT